MSLLTAASFLSLGRPWLRKTWSVLSCSGGRRKGEPGDVQRDAAIRSESYKSGGGTCDTSLRLRVAAAETLITVDSPPRDAT